MHDLATLCYLNAWQAEVERIREADPSTTLPLAPPVVYSPETYARKALDRRAVLLARDAGISQADARAILADRLSRSLPNFDLRTHGVKS